MAARSLITIGLALLAFIYLVDGDVSMNDICTKHKNAGRCTVPGIKKNCAKVCGEDEQPTEAPVDKETPKPTQKSATTKKQVTQEPTTKKQKSNKSCDKRSPCVSMEEANAAFRARCEASSLKPSCYDHCRYDEDTAAMKKAFLGGPCPLNQLRVYLTAASNSKDNTGCCQDTGVLAQKKTGICGVFCNPTGPVWPGKGEAAKYAPCVGVLTGIQQCHYYAEGAD